MAEDADKRMRSLYVAQVTGLLVSLPVLLLPVILAVVVWSCLTEYGSKRIYLVAFLVGGGGIASVVLYRFVSSYCRTRRRRLMVLASAAVLLATPPLSFVFPGKITYARFGLTVYGLFPVPMLDVKIDSHGMLRFRDKSHHIASKEVRELLSPEVDTVILGIGWNSMVNVDPAILKLPKIEVHVLPTPEAFDLFNRCVSEGRTVVLIAHSTC